MNQLPDLRSMNLEEMEAHLLSLGEKAFRGKQLFEWVHKKGVQSFDEMTNLSKALREKLASSAKLSVLIVKESLVSQVDGTRKYLFQLEDGQCIESVLMRYDHGNSLCVSTQAGCRMGCTFCASGLLGLSRQLSSGEILGQIYAVERDIEDRISHTVLMGTGEPLDNYENVVKFLKLIIDPKGKDMSQRHLTLSTCGLVPEIKKLAKENIQITLAISLHASSDAIRKKTMPIANKYSMDELFEACEVYFNTTGRRITFEYALIKGENDSREEALSLGRQLKARPFKCHVNLIPVNSIDENKFNRSDRASVLNFQKALQSYGVETTLRRTMGSDINGACGQLRLKDSK